ncbi:hypothetical protein L9F63_002744, partial [Diploptera punctata]
RRHDDDDAIRSTREITTTTDDAFEYTRSPTTATLCSRTRDHDDNAISRVLEKSRRRRRVSMRHDVRSRQQQHQHVSRTRRSGRQSMSTPEVQDDNACRNQ